jgi:signal transduction histidine kinase/ActR/RegA family two-component response regulator
VRGRPDLSIASLQQEALEHVPAGLGIFDVEGDIIRQVYLNDGFYRMIGAQREDRTRFRDTGTISSVHPDDRAGLLEEAKAAKREGRMFDRRFRNLNGQGSYSWIGITASHRPLDETTERFYATYYDASGLVDAQAKERDLYERSLQDIITATPGSAGIAHIDLTRNSFVWTHEPYESFSDSTRGKSWDELVGLVLLGVPEEEDEKPLEAFRCKNLLASFDAGTTHVSCEYRRRNENGRARWLASHARMLRNPENGHVECIAYTQDLSAARLSNEIFNTITSRSFDLVALIHLDTRVFEAVYLGDTLPAAYRALLPTPGATCDFDAFCSESKLHMDETTRADYESRLPSGYIGEQLRTNGGSYEFTLREHFDDKGDAPVYRRILHYSLENDPDAVLVIESDVTVEVEAEHEETARALAQAARDRLILDSIMGAISIIKLDESGHLSVAYFNSYVFEMLGYDSAGLPQTADQAKGHPTEPLFADALTFIHPDDRGYVTQAYLDHRDDESFSLRPYRMFGNNGCILWIKVKVRRGTDADGTRIFYVAMHDVTQEMELQKTLTERMEEERRLRQEADAANASKTEFLSRMSHDMRTPLNGIMGMTYLATQDASPEHARACLEKIDVSARFLLGLINDVLDMAKMESGHTELHPEPYPVEELNRYLDSLIRPLCVQKGQALVVKEDLPLDVCPLADKNAVNQVLFNLLSNAVKFTPEGGTITYQVSGKKVGSGRLAIEHRITDTGVGMSPEFLKRLFEPFVQEGRNDTSPDRGSGLGLAIAKRLVDLMGGTIAVESERGRGTTFVASFQFDAIPAQGARHAEKTRADRAGSVAEADTANLQGMHVLLCEDHPLNQEITKSLLEGRGAAVDVAGDGREGLEAFRRSESGFYDVVLMDVRMPDMDGREATEAIRALARPDARTVPIVAMTADAFADDVRKCLEAGMNGHIAKPVDPPLLFRVLAAYAPRE